MQPRATRQPGAFDASSLTAREQADLAESMNDLLAPCSNVPVTLRQCIADRRPCPACVPAARFLSAQVAAGRSKEEREAAYHSRFDDAAVKAISLDGSPTLGPADAKETVVVWADFECPHCALFEPMLEELTRRFPGKVRIVFKAYPLGSHAHADAAARAGIAAAHQGKFLPMARAMFENQMKLEKSDLEGYAKKAGLDLGRYRADLASKATSEALARDMKQADDLGLDGTPFVFVNGRRVDLSTLGSDPVESLADWVRLDLDQAGVDSTPAGR